MNLTKKEMPAEIDALKRRQAELEARILSLEQRQIVTTPTIYPESIWRQISGPFYSSTSKETP